MENLIFPVPLGKRPSFPFSSGPFVTDSVAPHARPVYRAGRRRHRAAAMTVAARVFAFRAVSPSARLFLRDAHHPRDLALHGNVRICLSTPEPHDDKRRQCWDSDRNYTNREITWEKTGTFTTPHLSEFVRTILTHEGWVGHAVPSPK